MDKYGVIVTGHEQGCGNDPIGDYLTDNLADPMTGDVAANLAAAPHLRVTYADEFLPVPPCLAVQYWNRAFKRADSNPTKKGKRAKARRERQDGTTYREALALVVGDLERAAREYRALGRYGVSEKSGTLYANHHVLCNCFLNCLREHDVEFDQARWR
ncbi:hypothetical protein VPNG_02223 [Cytospora leucostoma]|uniref:Uncharacterized protein n=1 Tax=Cytospora leucostoma TaxID=1230097 RepID=A0A423XGF9_9PEZI|nr:hypothetical protein VPNG_02223 [Cytospora leucostoma]